MSRKKPVEPRRPTSIRPSGKLNEDATLLFDRVAEDVLHHDRDLFDDLTEHERKLVVRWMSDAIVDEKGHSALHDVLWEIDFHSKPVGIETFIHDDYYFGKYAKDLHPAWKEDLYEVFRPGSPIFEWVMTGAIGIGKCCDKRSLVPTTKGLVPIGDVSRGAQVQAESGVREVETTHDEGAIETCRLVTRHGHVFEGSPRHRLRVLDGLSLGWKRLDQLAPGDVVLQAPTEQFGQDSLQPELAELIGWYVAEGAHYPHCRLFSLGDDEVQYVADLAQVCRALDGATVTPQPQHRRVYLSGACVDAYFPEGRSFEKEVPEVILRSDRASICAFLRGLFSGDGHSGASDCSVTTVSEVLARQTRVLLTSLGLYCTVTSKVPTYPYRGEKRNGRRAYTVRVVTAESLAQFAEEIGFAHDYKQERLEIRISREFSQNSSTSFAFRLRRGVAENLRAMQPRFFGAGPGKSTLPDGVTKATSPARLLERVVRGQRCTPRLLAQVADNGGVLPNALQRIVDGHLLFDEVGSVTRSHSPCADLTVVGDPSYVSETFVSHNTTLATTGLGYRLYTLSCMRDPAAYYGLLSGSLIVFGIYSITKLQVADTGYLKLRGYLDSSPYFRTEFPRSSKIDSKIDFMRSLSRPVMVVPGSQELHALGLDLFAFLMDEVNFMRVKDNKEAGRQTGQAYDLYNATYTRLQSRFIRPGGTIPGMMFLMSSRNAQTSFLEEHLKNVRNSPYTHVSDYALWDVKPAHRFRLPRFKVEVGDRVSSTRILTQIDRGVDRDRFRVVGEDTPREGSRIVEVPGEFYQPFTEDPDQALRDIAGVATFNLSPLIRDRQSVFDAFHPDMRHPFTQAIASISMDDDTRIEDLFVLERVCCVENSTWKPILNPSSPRLIHIDIGLSNDALGFAMGHVAALQRISRPNPDGTRSETTMPVVVIDLMLRVVAPSGTEVDLAKIRGFVLYLSSLFPVIKVTYDSPMSPGEIQMLRHEGVDSGHQSVDRTDEAYLGLRSALAERRLHTYQYGPFEDEVLDLVRDSKKRKVDHPLKSTRGVKGSKDVADAVAGVSWLCENDPRAVSPALPEFDRPKEPRAVYTSPETAAASRERRVGDVSWDALRQNLSLVAPPRADQ